MEHQNNNLDKQQIIPTSNQQLQNNNETISPVNNLSRESSIDNEGKKDKQNHKNIYPTVENQNNNMDKKEIRITSNTPLQSDKKRTNFGRI